MTEGQNWTFVDADNCVYQLVNVDDQQFNDFSTLENFLSSNQVMLADETGGQVVDQEMSNSENFVHNKNACGVMADARENYSAAVDVAVDEPFLNDPYAQPSTVIYVEDLKNQLNNENVYHSEQSNVQELMGDKSSKEAEDNVDDKLNSSMENLQSDADTDIVNIKLPKDPLELLDALMPMLEIKGGLRKNYQDSFLKIMKSCDLMPLQCLLINIIRSSQHSVLKKLLLMGGFDELHAWLKDARSQINKPLMLELLQLFKQLPVSTKLLRTNSCAKEIKQLIKNNDERISRFARVIVDDWMKVVSGDSAKPKDKTVVKAAVHKVDKKVAKRPVSPTKSAHSSEGKAKSEKVELSSEASGKNQARSESEDKTVRPERPKTVKRRQYTCRMTGLEEDATFKSNKKPSATAVTTTTTAAAITATTTATASALSGGPADVDANKSNFFDALQFNSSFLQHRKRKASVPPTPKATTTSTTTTTTSPTTAAATTSTTSASVAIITPATDASNDASATSAVLPEDDLSNILPNFSYYKPVEEAESAAAATKIKTTVSTTATTTTASSRLSPSRRNGDDGNPPAFKKVKKSVTWATDTSLCHFRYFEIDPTERCNVSTSNYFQHDDNETFVDHRRHEFQMEKELLQEWHKTQHAKEAVTIEWRQPECIEFEALNDVVPGCESKEKLVQVQREASVLQFIYFDKSTIPDFPSEPDPSDSPSETFECKLIPLHPVEEEEEGMETDASNQHADDSQATPTGPSIIHANQDGNTNSSASNDIKASTSSPSPVTLLPILSEMINDVLNKTATNTTNNNNNKNTSAVNALTSNFNENALNNDRSQNQSAFLSNGHSNPQTFYTGDSYSTVSHSGNNGNNGAFSADPNYNTHDNTAYAGYPDNNQAFFRAYNNDVNNGPFNPPNGPYKQPPFNNDYNFNDAQATEPAFTGMPFQQSTSNPVYPIGFNQPPFDSSNHRPPFDGGRGFQHGRGRPREFQNNFRQNGNLPPKKFNRNKNIDSSEVCRFFLQGKCLFGSNCKKIHPPK